MNCSKPGPGCRSRVLERALAPMVARGLVERSEKHWRATPKGFRFLNEILVELLPDAGTARALRLRCPVHERFYAQMPT